MGFILHGDGLRPHLAVVGAQVESPLLDQLSLILQAWIGLSICRPSVVALSN